jgi:hypothetical protein
MSDLPGLYFRIRENGAAVFRLETESRQRRMEMDQIATLNLRSGEIKPQGETEPSEAERAAMIRWMVARRATLEAREGDALWQRVEQINLMAHWAQSRATEAELEEVTEALLLAMHDLRGVLVRKKADRLPR